MNHNPNIKTCPFTRHVSCDIYQTSLLRHKLAHLFPQLIWPSRGRVNLPRSHSVPCSHLLPRVAVAFSGIFPICFPLLAKMLQPRWIRDGCLVGRIFFTRFSRITILWNVPFFAEEPVRQMPGAFLREAVIDLWRVKVINQRCRTFAVISDAFQCDKINVRVQRPELFDRMRCVSVDDGAWWLKKTLKACVNMKKGRMRLWTRVIFLLDLIMQRFNKLKVNTPSKVLQNVVQSQCARKQKKRKERWYEVSRAG